TPEKKFIVLISAIVLVFVLIGGLIIFPQYSKIKETNTQITALRQELETKYERAKQYHKSQTNLATAKKLTDEVKTRFLKKGEEIKLITILENKADALGLRQDLKLSSTYTKLPNNLSSIGLEIIITGDYKKTIEYLDFIQKNTFYISLDNLTITKSSPPPSTTDKNKIVTSPDTLTTFNLTTTVYVQE
ncbi:MAG: hypothetical protein NTU97_02275, partial [Candidatus Magasanikbacteria bacterium]|nr:hypothetical protein [Candidatus Magasanikbacteria bacterium]